MGAKDYICTKIEQRNLSVIDEPFSDRRLVEGAWVHTLILVDDEINLTYEIAYKDNAIYVFDEIIGEYVKTPFRGSVDELVVRTMVKGSDVLIINDSALDKALRLVENEKGETK